MALLAGRNVLVTGVITEASIAFHVARVAQLEGATVILTAYGRPSLVRRLAQRLPRPAPVIDLDVTNDDNLAGLAAVVGAHVPELHGVLHSVAFAPRAALDGNFLSTSWPDVSQTVHVSTYSLVALATAVRPLLRPGASIVGLDFDASVVWPQYDWMGVAKAALESTARYLAAYLGSDGIRVNLVAAGPLKTLAAASITADRDGSAGFDQMWADRAPLGWSSTDAEPVARACVALLSDWFPKTTGEIVHVDGGMHAMG